MPAQGTVTVGAGATARRFDWRENNNLGRRIRGIYITPRGGQNVHYTGDGIPYNNHGARAVRNAYETIAQRIANAYVTNGNQWPATVRGPNDTIFTRDQ